MKKTSRLLSLLLILALILIPTGVVSAQEPQPPTNPGCGLNPFCYLNQAGQVISSFLNGSNPPPAATPMPGVVPTNPPPSIIQQAQDLIAQPTPTLFRPPTAIPSSISGPVDTLYSYMAAKGTNVYALRVEGGNIIFPSDPNQVPASQQTGLNGRPLTAYLCTDPDTKYLVDWQCDIDLVNGTWTHGSAGYYADTLSTVSVSLSDVFFIGYTTKANEFFYASLTNYGCKGLSSNSGRTIYICSQYSQGFNELPTAVVQLPTATPVPTRPSVSVSNNYCGTSLLCSWNYNDNKLSMVSSNPNANPNVNHWVNDFILGGAGTLPGSNTFNAVYVGTSWLDSPAYCRWIYMPSMPWYNNAHGATQDYSVCLYTK